MARRRRPSGFGAGLQATTLPIAQQVGGAAAREALAAELTRVRPDQATAAGVPEAAGLTRDELAQFLALRRSQQEEQERPLRERGLELDIAAKEREASSAKILEPLRRRQAELQIAEEERRARQDPFDRITRQSFMDAVTRADPVTGIRLMDNLSESDLINYWEKFQRVMGGRPSARANISPPAGQQRQSQLQQRARAQQFAPRSKDNLIQVRDRVTGQIGTVPAAEFNAQRYEKL